MAPTRVRRQVLVGGRRLLAALGGGLGGLQRFVLALRVAVGDVRQVLSKMLGGGWLPVMRGKKTTEGGLGDVRSGGCSWNGGELITL